MKVAFDTVVSVRAWCQRAMSSVKKVPAIRMNRFGRRGARRSIRKTSASNRGRAKT
jgi:hypothetical protein